MIVIAVIDDEPLVSDVVREALRQAGAEVYCANDAVTVARLLLDHHFDVALIDVILPGGSGYDVAEVAANANTSVLMMTGHPEAAAHLMESDLPCLLKPFPLDELVTATSQVAADSRGNIERVKLGLARLAVNAAAMADTASTVTQKISEGQRLAFQKPLPPAPDGEHVCKFHGITRSQSISRL